MDILFLGYICIQRKIISTFYAFLPDFHISSCKTDNGKRSPKKTWQGPISGRLFLFKALDKLKNIDDEARYSWQSDYNHTPMVLTVLVVLSLSREKAPLSPSPAMHQLCAKEYPM